MLWYQSFTLFLWLSTFPLCFRMQPLSFFPNHELHPIYLTHKGFFLQSEHYFGRGGPCRDMWSCAITYTLIACNKLDLFQVSTNDQFIFSTSTFAWGQYGKVLINWMPFVLHCCNIVTTYDIVRISYWYIVFRYQSAHMLGNDKIFVHGPNWFRC